MAKFGLSIPALYALVMFKCNFDFGGIMGIDVLRLRRSCSLWLGRASMLLFVCFLASPAYADWEDYSDLTGTSRIVNVDQCAVRLKLTYNSYLMNAYRPTTQYFTLSNTKTYAIGSREYQRLYFDVTHAEGFVFYSFSLMSLEDFRTFQEDIEAGAEDSNQYRRDFMDFRVHLSLVTGSPTIIKFEYSRDMTLRNFDLLPVGSDPQQDTRLTLQVNCPEMKEISNVTADASSVYSSNYGPDRALDHNTSTYWITAYNPPTPITFTLTFDRIYQLGNLNLDWYPSYASNNFDVQISEDGTTYTTAASGLNSVSNVDLAGLSGKSVRLVIHSLQNPSTYVVLREISVQGR